MDFGQSMSDILPLLCSGFILGSICGYPHSIGEEMGV